MHDETTYSGTLGGLLRFKASMDANIDELAHLAPTHVRFGNRLLQTQDLAREQAAAIAEKQDRSQQIKTAIGDLQLQATVLRKAVRQFYGTRSEKLSEFGLQPFRGKKIAGRTEPDEPPTPPTTE